jgi:hypothetical protein
MLFNSPHSIADVYAQASISGSLTKAHRFRIRSVLLTGRMDEESQRCVDRLVYAVRRGRVQLMR